MQSRLSQLMAALPPRTPPETVAQRIRPRQLVDDVAGAAVMLWNDQNDEDHAVFKKCLYSMNGNDSYTGNFKDDDVIGAQVLKNFAIRKRVFPLLHGTLITDIKGKLQWAARRIDTATDPVSRGAQTKLIERQYHEAITARREAAEAAEAATAAETAPATEAPAEARRRRAERRAEASSPALVEDTIES